MNLAGIRKQYGATCALDRIDLQLEEGTITAILGESGAGKTTLLNILMGLTDYEGTVDGVSGKRAVRKEDCSYLFQEAKLLPNLTVEKNIAFVLDKSDYHKIKPMLARVGLQGKEDAYPHELSGGEKQRVGIARAFLYPHRTLLMDEPFSSLDLSLKKSLIELVYSLWEEHRETVVFVTHDVHEAAMLAHRAVVLSHGKVISDRTVPSPFPRDFLFHGDTERQLEETLLSLSDRT